MMPISQSSGSTIASSSASPESRRAGQRRQPRRGVLLGLVGPPREEARDLGVARELEQAPRVARRAGSAGGRSGRGPRARPPTRATQIGVRLADSSRVDAAGALAHWIAAITASTCRGGPGEGEGDLRGEQVRMLDDRELDAACRAPRRRPTSRSSCARACPRSSAYGARHDRVVGRLAAARVRLARRSARARPAAAPRPGREPRRQPVVPVRDVHRRAQPVLRELVLDRAAGLARSTRCVFA